MDPHARADSLARRPAGRLLRDPRVWLAVYAAVLAAIAYWPVPVDRDAGPLIRLLVRVLPGLTYEAIEFGANVLLFVPLGVLLAMILRRRWLGLPIAFGVTLAIELGQALLLTERTPALSDAIANLLGAAIGMLGVIAVESARSRIPS